VRDQEERKLRRDNVRLYCSSSSRSRRELEFTAHRFHKAAERADLEVGLMPHLGDLPMEDLIELLDRARPRAAGYASEPSCLFMVAVCVALNLPAQSAAS
jgi:hypothetical protein